MSESAVTVSPREAVIARPIGKEHLITVPAKKIYEHPGIQKIFGQPYAEMDQLRGDSEMLVIGDGPPAPDEEATQFRVSREPGTFAHDRSIHHRLDATKRSPEVTDDDVVVVKGIEYAGESSKGADFDFDRVCIERDPATNGLRVHGAVTKRFAERMIHASETLEREGIRFPGEAILRVTRPEQLPIPDLENPGSYKLVSQQEYKQWLIKKTEEKNASLPKRERVDMKEATKWIMEEENDLIVINRALMPFRLSDLTLPFQVPEKYNSPQDALQDFALMANFAISFINRGKEDGKLQSIKIPPSKNDREAITGFFEHFARNLANTTAMLHKKGIYHRSLHPGNIPIDGTICDIDSLGGTPFGEKLSESNLNGNLVADVTQVLNDLFHASKVFIDAGIMPQDMATRIGNLFLQEYITKREYGMIGLDLLIFKGDLRLRLAVEQLRAKRIGMIRDTYRANRWLNGVFKGLLSA